MTDEQSPRETEDEQPEVEGHKAGAPAPERVAARDEQEESEVEGHHWAFGPEKAMGPEKAKGPERAAF
jgi:hypothetical protein